MQRNISCIMICVFLIRHRLPEVFHRCLDLFRENSSFKEVIRNENRIYRSWNYGKANE